MDHRVARCHLIASVLAADGIFTQAERDFLHRAMDRLKLTDDERDKVRHFEGSERAEVIAKRLPEDVRRSLLSDLVEAAYADGQISPHEAATVARLAEQVLGLPAPDLI